MFGNDRSQLRQIFYDAWGSYKAKRALEPLQQMISQIILMHPEYHALLDDPEANLEKEYFPEQGEVNPFLHMAMHISVYEQLSTQRPEGINAIHTRLVKLHTDPHLVEHKMMECLSEMIWQSQKTGSPPDEQTYLKCLNKIAQN